MRGSELHIQLDIFKRQSIFSTVFNYIFKLHYSVIRPPSVLPVLLPFFALHLAAPSCGTIKKKVLKIKPTKTNPTINEIPV